MKGCVYAIGGLDGGKEISRVQRVNLSDGSVTDVARMRYPRSDFSAVTNGESIFVFGGIDGRIGGIALSEKYDPIKDRFVIICGTKTTSYSGGHRFQTCQQVDHQAEQLTSLHWVSSCLVDGKCTHHQNFYALPNYYRKLKRKAGLFMNGRELLT